MEVLTHETLDCLETELGVLDHPEGYAASFLSHINPDLVPQAEEWVLPRIHASHLDRVWSLGIAVPQRALALDQAVSHLCAATHSGASPAPQPMLLFTSGWLHETRKSLAHWGNQINACFLHWRAPWGSLPLVHESPGLSTHMACYNSW